jgi:hypothetical protein
VALYDNSTGPCSTAQLLFMPPSTTISNRKCRCVQHRHPERPTGVEGSSPNRKSGIRNPNNHPIFNPFHFSNRKYSAISRPLFPDESASHLPLVTSHCFSNRDTAIKTADKPHNFSHFQFSNRNKMRVLQSRTHQRERLSPRFPNLLVSVPPWQIFAIMAGSN